MLPQFTRLGVLPRGTYEMTIAELRSSHLVIGPKGDTRWDIVWREHLLSNLEILAKQLWSIGIEEIFVNGSFVENKDRPNDIDGYFVCSIKDQVDRVLERKLNAIDPHKAWGWDEHMRHPGRRLPLWKHYRVDMLPYAPGTMFGTDKSGRLLELSEAFRRTKLGETPKGIVKLKVARPQS